MFNFKFRKLQYGLTLIELMIALVLGVTVILGVSQGLVTMSLSSRVQDNNAKLQSDADSALSYISFKMRNALSTPCERLKLLNNGTEKLEIHDLAGSNTNAKGRPETIKPEQATNITNLLNGNAISVTSKTKTSSIGGVSNPTTDDITIVSAEERLTPSANVDLLSDTITIPSDFPNAKGANETLYSITDCAHMDVFRANKSQNRKGISLTFPAGTIVRAYDAPNSMISPVDVSQIIVDNDNRLISKTLFKKSAGPLMDNVELIRVIFAVDNDLDGITDQYITARQLGAFAGSNVISADVYIMVRIPGRNNDVAENYTLRMPRTNQDISTGNFMEDFVINDKIQRKVYMKSVVFRNNALIYK